MKLSLRWPGFEFMEKNMFFSFHFCRWACHYSRLSVDVFYLFVFLHCFLDLFRERRFGALFFVFFLHKLECICRFAWWSRLGFTTGSVAHSISAFLSNAHDLPWWWIPILVSWAHLLFNFSFLSILTLQRPDDKISPPHAHTHAYETALLVCRFVFG